MKLNAPATSRNTQPLMEVLRRILPDTGLVLEIASGSGQHALAFAQAFPELRWQPSDRDESALASAAAWRDETRLENLLEPIYLDVCQAVWPVSEAQVIFCANMIHIAPYEACLGLLAGAGRVLVSGGLLIIYGPFRVTGVPTAASNEQFDQSLRQRDARWGLRVLEEVQTQARSEGLTLVEAISMPSNNLCLMFRRQPGLESVEP